MTCFIRLLLCVCLFSLPVFGFSKKRLKRNFFYSFPICPCNEPRYINPCFIGSPILAPTGSPAYCNWQQPLACPAQYFCHIGAQPPTTCCCPQLSPDPCSQPINIGQGGEQLQRWYYDSAIRDCRQFIYQGRLGNQNNFISQEQCRQTCHVIVWTNPCLFPVTQEQAPKCSPLGVQGSCGPNSWCHVGATLDTTVCCPNPAPDICVCPKLEGEGTAQLQRWFFNAQSQQCETFVYKGLKGNQNNFLSQQDCQNTCPVWENACRSQPLMDPTGKKPRTCNPGNLCPQGYWCHVGVDAASTMCCASEGDPCSLPQIAGEGSSNLPRFYYDRNSHRCLPFTYQGKKGNQNNFLTQQDCVSSCPVFANPCTANSPAMDANGMPIKCGAGVNSCPLPNWCHFGLTADSTVCCPGPCDPCNSPRVQGQPLEGAASQTSAGQNRWYFDQSSGRCMQFQYAGAKGNCNNFLSRQDCVAKCPERNPCAPPGQPLIQGDQIVPCNPSSQSSCPTTHFCHAGADQSTTLCCPKTGNACDLPQTAGQGTASLPRFYYDKVQDQCLSFTYKGLAGNENNFLTQSACEQACPGMRGYCPHGKPLVVGGEPTRCSTETLCQQNYWCHVNTELTISICCPEPAYFCFLPMDVGTCSSNVQRYTYDPAADDCKPFTWSGCGGNLNNFETLDTCRKLCCSEQKQAQLFNLTVPATAVTLSFK